VIAARGQDRTEDSHGFALLVVLWFLVLIAAIGTYLVANARTESAIARNILSAARAEALADAGIAQAAFKLTETSVSNGWNLDGVPHRLILPDGEVIIRLHDETGKINPNHASDALMMALFEVAGVERVRARQLGAATADWVAPQSKVRRFGEQQYREAGKSYAPPNAALETVDELQLVLGMTPEILSSVRPYLTIHTESERPNGKNASQLVRQALALTVRESGDTAIPIEISARETVDATLANGTPAATTDKPEETIVEIEVNALAAGGGIFVRQAVLKIDPASRTGYVVLDWRRGELIKQTSAGLLGQ
jgi:general secretion pathway protein K